MLWIGLTGGIASGKSTVAKYLRELGHPVVEADLLAHRAYEKNAEGYKLLIQAFGTEILSENQDIDRKTLGQMAFSDEKKMKKLEAIIHPIVQDLALKEKISLEEKAFPMAFYEIPLLYEKKLADKFDVVVVVAATQDLQIERMIKRNNLSRDEALQRITKQLPMEEKLKQADYVIYNKGHEADLRLETEKMIEFCFTRPKNSQAQN